MATLSGRWIIRAIVKESGWDQGILITGSAAHDGLYNLVVGDEIDDVEGDEITLTPQYRNPGTNTWHDSAQQSEQGWDDTHGLTLTIYADDVPPSGDLDFDDLIVRCLPIDDELSSPHAGYPRPDLTVPEQWVHFP